MASTRVEFVIPPAVFAAWITPALPLYGNDHERADFAP
jgi:hypothetical protein